jgi:tRNA threonylcarbamoyladenosine biosynthesis protein TsaE
MNKIFIENQQEMANFAIKMAKSVKNHQIITLEGNLGAGKSFFAKNFISFLTGINKSEITSPTFNIYNHYQINQQNIYHFDLYRIKNEGELDNIGFYDLLKDGICLIEWPEIAKRYLSQPITQINFNIISEFQREILYHFPSKKPC